MVVVAVVVWVMVGLFFLLPGSGTDQAHDWALDPIPSNSQDDVPTDTDSSAGDAETSTPSPSAPGTPTSPGSAPSPRGAPPEEPTAGSDLELADAAAPATNQPRPRPSSDAPDPAPTESTPGPPADNPGKKKGHDKPHGPHGRP